MTEERRLPPNPKSSPPINPFSDDAQSTSLESDGLANLINLNQTLTDLSGELDKLCDGILSPFSTETIKPKRKKAKKNQGQN